MQRIQNIQLGGPEKLIGWDDPRHVLQENGSLADQWWYLDDGDILCHPMLVLPSLQPFDTANAFAGCVTDQLATKADVLRAMHERVQLCQDPQTEFALRERLGVRRINHIRRVHGHNNLHERQAAIIFDEVGRKSLGGLFTRFTEDTSEQAALSASQSGIRYRRARNVACPAHPGALRPAKPSILCVIRGAGTVRLLPEQRDALHDSENATARLYLQKAAQAADESWQQTVQGYNGPTITNPTLLDIVATPHSMTMTNSELTFAPPRKSWLSAPQLQAQLSRLSDRTRLRRLKNNMHSKGAWQHVTRFEDICHTEVSHQWLHHLDACCVFTPRDCITNVQKKTGQS